MALADTQRYPSYWHTDSSASPRWVKTSTTKTSKRPTKHGSCSDPSPMDNSTPKTPSVLRQTVLDFSPSAHSVDSESTIPMHDSGIKPEAADASIPTSCNAQTSSQIKIISSLTPQLQRGKLKSKLPEPAKQVRTRRALIQRKVTVKSIRVGSADRRDSVPMVKQSTSVKKSNSLSPNKSRPPLSDVTDTAFVKSGSIRQTQLTTYGIRRTARQFLKDQERQRDENVRMYIRDGRETGMKIILTEEKGRGVVATRGFHEGDFVVEYAGDLISEKVARQREYEYKKDPTIGSYMFFFVHNGQKFCVDATCETPRLGRLINHSRLHPNCVVKVIQLDRTPRLVLFAKQTIDPGEEFLYDYGDRDKETMEAHPWLKT